MADDSAPAESIESLRDETTSPSELPSPSQRSRRAHGSSFGSSFGSRSALRVSDDLDDDADPILDDETMQLRGKRMSLGGNGSPSSAGVDSPLPLRSPAFACASSMLPAPA